MSEALAPVTAPAPEAPAPVPAQNEAASPAPAETTDQPVTFATMADFDKAVDARLAAVKQDWLNESFRNTQSMNDKFTAAVNAKLQQLTRLGIKADTTQAAKLVQAEQALADQQARQTPPVDPNYQNFLNRFNARSGNDERLRNAFALETEYGIQLTRDDPEFQKYFADPNKAYPAAYFMRTYEKALQEKQTRTAADRQPHPANPAALPSLSGNGPQGPAFSNTTSSADILSQGVREMRSNRK